jgi:hypothetical protein
LARRYAIDDAALRDTRVTPVACSLQEQVGD